MHMLEPCKSKGVTNKIKINYFVNIINVTAKVKTWLDYGNYSSNINWKISPGLSD